MSPPFFCVGIQAAAEELDAAVRLVARMARGLAAGKTLVGGAAVEADAGAATKAAWHVVRRLRTFAVLYAGGDEAGWYFM